jgi:hypothetical protein
VSTDQLTGWVADRPPRGWDVLAGLPPLPGRVCLICDAPAIVGTLDGYRCAAHPPRWGQGLDWTPKGRPCAGVRCYCGRCPTYRIGSYGSTLQAGTTDLKKQRVALGGVHAQHEAVSGRRLRVVPDGPPTGPEALSGRPAASAGHPATSHAAADRLAGLPVGRIRLDVFRAIRGKGRGGATDDELEVLLGRPHQTVSSARNALVERGYIVAGTVPGVGPATRPTRSGHRATVWVVSAAAEHLPQ